jgi:hypothetical protein
MPEISAMLVVHIMLVGLIVFRASIFFRQRFPGTSSSNPIQGSVPRHRLLAAIDIAGGIAVALVWIALAYTRPPLRELWQNSGTHWTAALAMTFSWLWLAGRLGQDVDAGTALYVRVALRAILLAVPFLWAMAVILNW